MKVPHNPPADTQTLQASSEQVLWVTEESTAAPTIGESTLHKYVLTQEINWVFLLSDIKTDLSHNIHYGTVLYLSDKMFFSKGKKK